MSVLKFEVPLSSIVEQTVRSVRDLATFKDGSVDTDRLASELLKAIGILKRRHGLMPILVAMRPHMDAMTDAEFVSYGRCARAMAARKKEQAAKRA